MTGGKGPVPWEWVSLGDELPEPPVDLLAVLLDRPAWQRDVLCIEHPEVGFFPLRGESVEPARAICGRCLVQAECRTYALELDERFGIWGGAPAPAGPCGRGRRPPDLLLCFVLIALGGRLGW